ncbi:hypothetical protein QTP70_008492 [Hemibagrus guttatus]|uniref:ribonuclease H n=1 Tax=Hemibagrus guttatus TaxID=175788 RepID=A0AAE0V417_9TELE|nr:hypothetical protein QTP70_008492 [Hemibagrus guttatus]
MSLSGKNNIFARSPENWWGSISKYNWHCNRKPLHSDTSPKYTAGLAMGQAEADEVIEDLEKAYDRVPREELWYCMRKSGVAEKYVRVVQDMYERSRTVLRCAVGQTEEFKVEVGLHQGLAMSPFMFAMVMDQLSEEVRQESPCTILFADDIVICSESREQVEENLERWRFVLERRGMKVSCKISALSDHAALPAPTPGFHSHHAGPLPRSLCYDSSHRSPPAFPKTGPTSPETIGMSTLDPISELVEALRCALTSAPAAGPPAITSASTATSPSPPVIASPVATPAPFSGSAEDCNGFLLQCSLALEMQPHLYPNDRTKVAFIISHLDGKALRWAEPIWTQNNSIVTSLPNFIEHFKEVFGKPAWDSSIGERLCRLKQGVMSVSDYALQFQTLTAASGWNEKALITMYRQGLNPRIRLHLAAYEDSIGLEKFIQLSIRFATRMQLCLKEHQDQPLFPTTLRQPDPVSHPEPASEPMHLEHSDLSTTER